MSRPVIVTTPPEPFCPICCSSSSSSGPSISSSSSPIVCPNCVDAAPACANIVGSPDPGAMGINFTGVMNCSCIDCPVILPGSFTSPFNLTSTLYNKTDTRLKFAFDGCCWNQVPPWSTEGRDNWTGPSCTNFQIAGTAEMSANVWIDSTPEIHIILLTEGCETFATFRPLVLFYAKQAWPAAECAAAPFNFVNTYASVDCLDEVSLPQCNIASNQLYFVGGFGGTATVCCCGVGSGQ